MKFHGKNKAKIFLFILVIISMSSAGYDLYAHSIMYSFPSEFTTHSYIFFDDDLVLPRYFLLSYIYGFSRSLGIPIGWVAVGLCCIPSFKILASNKVVDFKVKEMLIFIILILVYFYSGLTLVILWLLAYFFTGNRFYLIGGLFHPVGIILATISLLFNKNKISSCFILILMFVSLLSASFVFLKFNIISGIIDLENIKLKVNFKSLVEIIMLSYDKKSNEINGLVVFLIIFKFINPYGNNNKYIIIKIANKISYKKITQAVIFLMLLNSFTRDYNSFLCSAVYCEPSKAIYVTWFDFGDVTPDLDFYNVFNSRFDKVEGFL